MSLLLRAQLRSLWRERWQFLLALLGIAAGVAVVVAVDLANASSREAMRLASERLDGSATHAITGPGERLDERWYPELRLRWRQGAPAFAEVVRMAPLLVADVGLASDADRSATRSAQLLGIDPLAGTGAGAVSPDMDAGAAQLLTTPDGVLLDQASAERLALQPGDAAWLVVAGQRQPVEVLGTLAMDAQVLGQGLVVADLATAQELLGRQGWLSRIDLEMTSAPAASAPLRWLERLFPGFVPRPTRAPEMPLPGGLQLQSLAERSADTRALASAFQLNLAALGVLALVVGLFLVHGTLTFAVWRRQREFGRLRALGVLPAELMRMILAEAAVLALLGTALGLLLGWLLAQQLLGAIAVTLEGLYDQVAVGGLIADPVPLLKGGVVALLGTLLAAWPAARRAALASPTRLLSRQVVRVPRLRGRRWALGVLVAAGALLLLPGTGYLGALAAIGAWLGAAALLTPVLVRWLLSGLLAAQQRLMPRPSGGLAFPLLVRETIRGLDRSGVATAALVVAIATAVGMGVMVASFRDSVERWLDSRLAAPLQVQLPGERRQLPEALARARDWPEINGWVAHRVWSDRIADQPVRVDAVSVQGRVPDDLGLDLLAGTLDSQGVWLSEPLARRLEVWVGDALPWPAYNDDRRPQVSAVFREYGAGPGLVLVPAARAPARAGRMALEVHVAESQQAAATARLLAAAPAATRVRSNAELRAGAQRVFDQTFRVTTVLQWIAGLVAGLGLFGALVGLGLQRRAQYGVLRTLGVSRWGPVLQNFAEALLLGLAALLPAIPLGCLVAWILVDVVNLRAFHWTLSLNLPGLLLLQAAATVLVAALAAALGPALWLWRAPAARLLREARRDA